MFVWVHPVQVTCQQSEHQGRRIICIQWIKFSEIIYTARLVCYPPRIRDMVKVFSLVTQGPGRSLRGSRGKSFQNRATARLLEKFSRLSQGPWKQQESSNPGLGRKVFVTRQKVFRSRLLLTARGFRFARIKKRNTASLFNLKVLVTVGVRPGFRGFQRIKV